MRSHTWASSSKCLLYLMQRCLFLRTFHRNSCFSASANFGSCVVVVSLFSMAWSTLHYTEYFVSTQSTQVDALCNVFGWWGLGWNLIGRASDLNKEPTRTSHPFSPSNSRIQQKESHLQTRKQVLTISRICQHLHFGFPSLQNCEKKFLLLTNHQDWGILF